MKKLFWFCVSLSGAFFLFCLIAFLCVFLSKYKENSQPPVAETPITAAVPSETLFLTVIFANDEKTLLCDLEITPKNDTVISNSAEINEKYVETTEDEDNTFELYPFIGRCLSVDGKKRNTFILTDNENFSKITDISGGIVYNDNLEGEQLLTGVQVLVRLDRRLFENVCHQIAERTFLTDNRKLFSYITENTVNNLSYPDIYSVYY